MCKVPLPWVDALQRLVLADPQSVYGFAASWTCGYMGGIVFGWNEWLARYMTSSPTLVDRHVILQSRIFMRDSDEQGNSLCIMLAHVRVSRYVQSMYKVSHRTLARRSVTHTLSTGNTHAPVL